MFPGGFAVPALVIIIICDTFLGGAALPMHPENHPSVMNATQRRVVGGPIGDGTISVATTVKQGDHEWVARLYYGTTARCTAAVVSRTKLITAAHCFYSDVDNTGSTFDTGELQSHKTYEPGQLGSWTALPGVEYHDQYATDLNLKYSFASIAVHPNYKPECSYSDYDVAVITLRGDGIPVRHSHAASCLHRNAASRPTLVQHAVLLPEPLCCRRPSPPASKSCPRRVAGIV